LNPTTHQAGQSTQPSTVPAAGQATKLALDKKFRDSHSRAIDCVLLPATAGTAMLIEELGRLAHGHADQLCLRTAATTSTASTRCEFFERLCPTEVQIMAQPIPGGRTWRAAALPKDDAGRLPPEPLS